MPAIAFIPGVFGSTFGPNLKVSVSTDRAETRERRDGVVRSANAPVRSLQSLEKIVQRLLHSLPFALYRVEHIGVWADAIDDALSGGIGIDVRVGRCHKVKAAEPLVRLQRIVRARIIDHSGDKGSQRGNFEPIPFNCLKQRHGNRLQAIHARLNALVFFHHHSFQWRSGRIPVPAADHRAIVAAGLATICGRCGRALTAPEMADRYCEACKTEVPYVAR